MSAFLGTSLRARLLRLIILAVIPILVLIFYTAFEQRKHREMEIREETMRTARHVANNLEQLIEGSRQVLVGFSNLHAIRQRNSAVCNAYFSGVIKELPMYANIAAAKTNGNIFCSAVPIVGSVNISDRLYFQTAVEKKTYSVGEFIIDRVIKKPTISVAIPMLDRDQKPFSIIYLSLDLRWIKDQLDKMEIPDQASLSIVDKNLTILYRNPDYEQWAGTNVSNSFLTKIIEDNEEGIALAIGLDGITRLSAFTPVRGTNKGMHVRYGIAYSAAFADINNALIKNVSALLVIVFVILFAVWHGADYFFLRRIKSLMKTTKDLANGDLNARVQAKPGLSDEIAELGSRFNSMAEALEGLITESRLTEKTFLENHERLDLALQAAHMGIWRWEIQEDKRYFDKQVCLLLGIAPDGFRGTEAEFFSAVHPDDRALVRNKLSHTLEQNVPYEADYRAVWFDGTTHYLNARGKLVRDGANRPLRINGVLMDISARKWTEEALQESEERFRGIASSTPDLLFVQDLDLKYSLMINYPLGLTEQDVIGKTDHDFLSLEDAQNLTNLKQYVLKNEKTLHVGISLKSRENEVEYFDGSYVPKFDQNIRIAGLIGYFKNVTGQRLDAFALQQAKADWERTFNSMHDLIMILDTSCRIIKCNKAMAQSLGISESNLIGLTCYEQVHGTSTPPLHCPHTLLMSDQQAHSAEIYDPHHKRHYILTVTPLFGGDGKLTGCVHAAKDVTERKKIEETLRERNLWINTILEASPTAIIALDINGIVLTWNKKAEQVFGWTFEEVVGKMIPIIPEDKVEEFKNNREKILHGSPFMDVELRRRRKDGSLIDVSVSSAPLSDSAGTLNGMISVIIDITNQKQLKVEHDILENQLRQVQKMEAIGQFAGGVAHDFNNILGAIMGYSHLAIMKINNSDPNHHNLKQILASSERAAVLTQNLLTFSRKQPINLSRINLNDIVIKFEKFLLRLIREDIELKTELAYTELPIVADQNQIEQILMNLVTNARDAMPQGGRIIIKSGLESRHRNSPVSDMGCHEGDYAFVSVEDSGEGIPEDIRNKIFDPFFTTKELGHGTGLGLATVYGIVKKHGGCIDVQSEQGKGTTFKIYLPAAQKPAQEYKQKMEEQSRPQGGVETILIAEDDTALRTMTATILRQYGYTVIEASDGLDAVAKFTEYGTNIPLVIFDGIMPRLNGREAWQKIRSHSSSVKAIFVSGYAENIFTQDGVLEKDIVLISKPFPPLSLVSKIREVLDGAFRKQHDFDGIKRDGRAAKN